jgi:hypothetical protein
LSWLRRLISSFVNTVLAVNSYVTNYNCDGVGYSQRIDTPAVRSWIGGFMD